MSVIHSNLVIILKPATVGSAARKGPDELLSIICVAATAGKEEAPELPVSIVTFPCNGAGDSRLARPRPSAQTVDVLRARRTVLTLRPRAIVTLLCASSSIGTDCACTRAYKPRRSLLLIRYAGQLLHGCLDLVQLLHILEDLLLRQQIHALEDIFLVFFCSVTFHLESNRFPQPLCLRAVFGRYGLIKDFLDRGSNVSALIEHRLRAMHCLLGDMVRLEILLCKPKSIVHQGDLLRYQTELLR